MFFMKKYMLLTLLCTLMVGLGNGQALIKPDVEDKKAKKIKKRLIRKMTNKTWEEYKRVYFIRGDEREYNYSGKRLLRINAKDSSFLQSDQVGHWELIGDKIMAVYADNKDQQDSSQQRLIGNYLIYKATNKDLILVKPLSQQMDNKIVYYYRRSAFNFKERSAVVQSGVKGLNLHNYQNEKLDVSELESKSKEELIQLLQSEYFRRSTQPPRNLNRESKQDLIQMLTAMYNL